MLLDNIRSDFIGLFTSYTTQSGRLSRRCYLDSAASTLMMRVAHETAGKFLEHYSNTHSTAHFSAKISTEAMSWANRKVLDFLGADHNKYISIFNGSGATGCLNLLARSLQCLRPDKSVVLVSLMEHHSNDLPHRKYASVVEHIPLMQKGGTYGTISLAKLEEQLIAYKGRVNYVAVTGASNVTGLINPIHDIAELAHQYGAYIVVDGAQMAAHMPVCLSCNGHPERDIDVFVFSGHKAYAPGSPGVLVIKKKLLIGIEPQDLGGGMVDDVDETSYKVKTNFPDREQAGTANILGAITLACVFEVLSNIGMDKIFNKEKDFMTKVIKRLREVEEVEIYGHLDTELYPRIGSVPFNLKGLDHGLVAAVLNDYHNIAVRNGCFCAHPYVRELIKKDLWELDLSDQTEEEIEQTVNLKKGMVRASFGIYTTDDDVDILVNGLRDVCANAEFYRSIYTPQKDGNYLRNSHIINSVDLFHPEKAIHASLRSRFGFDKKAQERDPKIVQFIER